MIEQEPLVAPKNKEMREKLGGQMKCRFGPRLTTLGVKGISKIARLDMLTDQHVGQKEGFHLTKPGWFAVRSPIR